MGATHAEVELLLEEHGGHAGRAARVLRARHPGPAGQGVSPLPVTESNPLHDGPQSSMGPPASEVVSLVAPRSDSKRYQAEAGAAGLVEHQRDGKLAGGRLVPQPQPEPEPQPQPELYLEPEPEPEPEPDEQLMRRTSTLSVTDYAGETVTRMYHGTDSRAAQLIVAAQRFRPSTVGLLGEGVYVTRTRQKAEGYRIHHPNVAVSGTGGSEVNVPLRPGVDGSDPGCILEFRCRLGIVREFTRKDIPTGPKVHGKAVGFSTESWSGAEVPESMRTNSMKRAAMTSPTRPYGQVVRFNAAYSPGCACCPTHGIECPGHPENGHNQQPPGAVPCKGRCKTGWRQCPHANSTFEEFCIGNPDRIDQIRIVDGPPELVGFGEALWGADQAALDAVLAAKQAEIDAEKAEAKQVATTAFAAVSQAVLAAAPAASFAAALHPDKVDLQQKANVLNHMFGVEDMHLQSLGTNFGLELRLVEGGKKFQRFSGAYTRVEKHNLSRFGREAFTVVAFGHVADRQRCLYLDKGLYRDRYQLTWWLIDDATTQEGALRCTSPYLPLGTTKWSHDRMHPFASSSSSTCSINLAGISAARVAEHKAVCSQQALRAVRAQLAGLVLSSADAVWGLAVQGHAETDYNGLYCRDADYLGWPHFSNASGVHLFRDQETTASWILSKKLLDAADLTRTPSSCGGSATTMTGVGAGGESSGESESVCYCISSRPLLPVTANDAKTDVSLMCWDASQAAWTMAADSKVSCSFLVGSRAQALRQLDAQAHADRQQEAARVAAEKARLEQEQAAAWILGTVVWVRDGAKQHWTKGIVEGHCAKGRPLVRPIFGRVKDCTKTFEDGLNDPSNIWGREESQIPREWAEVHIAAPGFTADALLSSNRRYSWSMAVDANGSSSGGALVAALARLLLLHLSRTTVACVAYYMVYYELPTQTQYYDDNGVSGTSCRYSTDSGVCVDFCAGGDTCLATADTGLWCEGALSVLTLCGLLANPAFLLVDVRASLRERGWNRDSLSWLLCYLCVPATTPCMVTVAHVESLSHPVGNPSKWSKREKKMEALLLGTTAAPTYFIYCMYAFTFPMQVVELCATSDTDESVAESTHQHRELVIGRLCITYSILAAPQVALSATYYAVLLGGLLKALCELRRKPERMKQILKWGSLFVAGLLVGYYLLAGAGSGGSDPGCADYVAIGIPGTCNTSGLVEIVDVDECRVAIGCLNEARGMEGLPSEHGDVDEVDYSFRNAGCFSSCFNSYSGYFCNYFNSNSAGIEDGDGGSHQFCRRW